MAGTFPAAIVPAFSATLALVTIVTCYVLTVTGGYEPPILPDITHCAKNPPAMYIFRIGMLPACCGLAFMWYIISAWLAEEQDQMREVKGCMFNSVSSVIGILASITLILSSSVIETDTTPWTFHTICATSFFVLTLIAQLLLTFTLVSMYRTNKTFITARSLNFKILMVTLNVIVFTFDLITSSGIINMGTLVGAACEWLLTFIVLLYSVSFTGDFYGKVYIGTEVAAARSYGGPLARYSKLADASPFNNDF